MSGSEFKTWRRCRRKWLIEYVWKITLPSAEPGALGIGSLAHEGLEVITNGGSLTEAKLYVAHKASLALDELNAMNLQTDDATKKWISAASDAQTYIDGYVEWLESSGADQRYETYAAEEEITMPLIELLAPDGEVITWVLRGKLDRRVLDRFTGRHVFMDYKTCARFEDIEEAAYRNEQFPTYEMLMRHKYPDERCGSGVWRMLRKVKRTRDGDDEFFRDYVASYNDQTMHAVLDRFRMMAMEMHLVESSAKAGNILPAYPAPDFRCAWDCRYRHECVMFDDGSRVQDALSEQYVSFDPYERYNELKG